MSEAEIEGTKGNSLGSIYFFFGAAGTGGFFISY